MAAYKSKKRSVKRNVKKSRKVKSLRKSFKGGSTITLKNKSQSFKGMCLSGCKRTMRQISNAQFVRNPNGSVRVFGGCSQCGGKVNTFASKKLFN
jgi:hypothetical protein